MAAQYPHWLSRSTHGLKSCSYVEAGQLTEFVVRWGKSHAQVAVCPYQHMFNERCWPIVSKMGVPPTKNRISGLETSKLLHFRACQLQAQQHCTHGSVARLMKTRTAMHRFMLALDSHPKNEPSCCVESNPKHEENVQ